MKGKLMENLAWIEVEQSFKHQPFLIIPLGPKSKEHGYHLPMNTDWIMAEYFRDKLLEKFDVLAAPTIDINFFPAFTQYPGSEHLDLETSVAMVYQKCKSHTKHGVTHIYIINMGISTNRVLEKVQEMFRKENVNFQYLDQKKYDVVPEITAIQQQQRGTHADELETSMMLYIKPEVVKMDRAVKDDNDEIDPKNPGPLTRDPNAKLGVYSASGVWGNPQLATVKKGRIVVEKYLELMEAEVQSLLFDCRKQKEQAQQPATLCLKF